jgi:hypothetical protein
MAKLGPIHIEVTPAILVAFVEQQSVLLVDRDKYKALYESSQEALTVVLEELTEMHDTLKCAVRQTKMHKEIANNQTFHAQRLAHELDSIRGSAHV